MRSAEACAERHGSTKGALALARLGFPVKELIGGIEYWLREGYPVVEG